jgi:hypothetical protein
MAKNPNNPKPGRYSMKILKAIVSFYDYQSINLKKKFISKL